MRVGEVVRQTGVGREALRFYEREGLIADPPRDATGYRQYAPEVVRRLRFIKRAQQLGFTLHEIADLLTLRFEKPGSCGAVEYRASIKIEDIEAKVRDLERMHGALVKLRRACRARRTSANECPILDALDPPGRP